MRISDWSSDVCSSDLIAYAHRRHDSFGEPRYEHHALGARQGGQQWRRRGQHIARKIVLDNQKAVTLGQLQQLERDRKSVVEGKSVSVRVDLGGGRIIENTRVYEK